MSQNIYESAEPETTSSSGANADGKIDVMAFLDVMELGEMEELEELTGEDIGPLLAQFQTNRFKAKTLTAITFLILRRQNPEATIEDARHVRLVDLLDETDETESEDDSPKDEASEEE